MAKNRDVFNKDNISMFPKHTDSEIRRFNLFWLLLKWSFIAILAIWVFRMALNFGVGAISFTDLLLYIRDCPDYFSLFVDNVLSNVIFMGSTDSVNLPIFGSLLSFLKNVLILLVYLAGCMVVAIRYISYFFGIIFTI